MENRLPAMMSVSVAAHLAAGFFWVRLGQTGPKTVSRVIGNVDFIKVRAQVPQLARPAAPKATPPSTWNFLKLALPTIPKAAQPLDVVKPVEPRVKLLEAPEKLDDKGHLKKPAPLEALDLDNKRAPMAQLDASKLEAASHRAVPVDAPKLEEVGMRRAPRKVLEMAALREAKGQLAPQEALGDLSALQKSSRHVADDAPALQDAPPAEKPSLLGKVRDLLSSEPPPLALQPEAAQPAPAPRKRLDALDAPKLAPKPEAALTEKKKAMEIEGPLASRRLVYYELPTFPDWLKAQGGNEAEVRIKFYVNPGGTVEPDMRVDTTSGYGRLDRLCIQSLSSWRFESIAGTGRQWGIITFRFELE